MEILLLLGAALYGVFKLLLSNGQCSGGDTAVIDNAAMFRDTMGTGMSEREVRNMYNREMWFK